MRFIVLALAGALVVGGCAQLPEAGGPVAPPAPVEAPPQAPIEPAPQAPIDAAQAEAEAEAVPLLDFFARLRRVGPAELARERELARRAFSAEHTDERRMRYAITLSVSIDGSIDAARALELVDPVAKRRDSPYQSLAILMRSLLADLSQSLRERSELLRERTELQRERSELQRERSELQRKLDSLKALEKSLSDREGGTR